MTRGHEPHPLLSVLLAAADGVFPPVDGRAVFVPALYGGVRTHETQHGGVHVDEGPASDLQAVVSFTGHAIVATDLPAAAFADLGLDGFGRALQPAVLQRLAGPGGQVGVIDVTLVAAGLGGGSLASRDDLDEHPRVRLARALRGDVRVHGDDRGLVTLARGLAGRTELSVETSTQQGQGVGRSLILEALRLAPEGEPVFAAVAPGNARSLRAFLALGFQPLGSEVLIQRSAPAQH